MKVYHGTCASNLDSILKNGIKPRGRKKGNWESYPSKKDMVYLTVAYAPYFAICSCEKSQTALILEIDLSLLDEDKLYPDEDFVAQVLAYQNNTDIDTYHDHVSNNLDLFKSCYQDSLDGLGNISYKGTVPSSSITRYCLVDVKERKDISLMCLDPSISLMNYKFCGNRYRSIISWLFGDREDFELGITGNNKEWIYMMEKSCPGYEKQITELFVQKSGIEVRAAA